jgi:hypothetical protein
MKKSTRDIGNKLEKYTLASFESFDSKARRTKNSGAGLQKGDLYTTNYIFECKKRDTKNCTIVKKVWDKLCREIPTSSLKTPVLILENNCNDKFAVLDFNDFIRIAEELYEKRTS